jgi:hypothetical protein
LTLAITRCPLPRMTCTMSNLLARKSPCGTHTATQTA